MSSELDALQFYGLGDPVKPIETSFASATQISPVSQISIVTGTTAVATINIPWPGFAGSLDFIYTTTGTITAWVTTGNIALATTPVLGKALRMTYSQISGKWYPSY